MPESIIGLVRLSVWLNGANGVSGGEDVAIPLAQQRKLFQRSGNMCAFPDCRVLLTVEGTPGDPVVVLGEIAHIVAESPGGPRGESPLTAKQRNSYPNLILLCDASGEAGLQQLPAARVQAGRPRFVQGLRRRRLRLGPGAIGH
jgi:hypothetical protein